MTAWKAFITVLAMAFSTAGWAKTWYTRPLGAVYGDGDGGSYANAWSGFRKIEKFVRNGDSIVVCGTHRETLIVRRSHLTINLNCPNDPAIILGSDNYSNVNWKGPDAHGEYTMAFAKEPHVIAIDGNVLLKGIAGSLKSGQFAVAGRKPYILHIKDDPKGREIEVGQRAFGIQLGDKEKDVVRGITILGGGKAWIKFVGAGNRYQFYGKGIAAIYDSWPHSHWGGTWIIDGVNFYGIEEHAIHVNAENSRMASTPDHIIIRNCRILENGGEGIYVKGVFGSGLIENNVIGDRNHHKEGWDGIGFGDAYDGDGIDLGGGPNNAAKNFTVTGNTISNIRGNGIVANAGNLTVKDNVIVDPNSWGESVNKACIIVDPVYSEPTNIQGNICQAFDSDGLNVRGAVNSGARITVSQNLVILHGNHDDHAVIRQSAHNAYNIHYFNNTLIGGKYGIYWSSETNNPTDTDIANNIFYQQDFPIYMLPETASGIAMRNNLFFPSGKRTEPYRLGAAAYAHVANMQAQQPTFSGNIHDDPRFVDASRGDYHLSDKSPATGAGVRWWSSTQPSDLVGRPRRKEHVNIGAFQ